MWRGLTMKEFYTIGEISKIFNIPSATLRYYDSIGLLCPWEIGENNYRYYSKAQFESCFASFHGRKITPSDVWYEDRTDFSAAAVGTMPVSHNEEHGYELLQGSAVFEGELLGGCIESMGEMLLAGNIDRFGELLSEDMEKCPQLAEDLNAFLGK